MKEYNGKERRKEAAQPMWVGGNTHTFFISVSKLLTWNDYSGNHKNMQTFLLGTESTDSFYIGLQTDVKEFRSLKLYLAVIYDTVWIPITSAVSFREKDQQESATWLAEKSWGERRGENKK